MTILNTDIRCAHLVSSTQQSVLRKTVRCEISNLNVFGNAMPGIGKINVAMENEKFAEYWKSDILNLENATSFESTKCKNVTFYNFNISNFCTNFLYSTDCSTVNTHALIL